MVSQDAAMRCVTEARFLFNCRNLPQGAGREVYQKRRNPRAKEPGSELGNERSEDTGPRSENSTQTGRCIEIYHTNSRFGRIYIGTAFVCTPAQKRLCITSWCC